MSTTNHPSLRIINLFIYGVGKSDFTAGNDSMTVNNTFSMMWKESITVQSEVLFKYLTGQTEGNHKIEQM